MRDVMDALHQWMRDSVKVSVVWNVRPITSWRTEEFEHVPPGGEQGGNTVRPAPADEGCPEIAVHRAPVAEGIPSLPVAFGLPCSGAKQVAEVAVDWKCAHGAMEAGKKQAVVR